MEYASLGQVGLRVCYGQLVIATVLMNLCLELCDNSVMVASRPQLLVATGRESSQQTSSASYSRGP